MKRIILATLMALVFGLFSMPTLRAASVNGSALTTAIKEAAPVQQAQYRRRRRRRRCGWVHRGRSRRRWQCWW
jgi:hypothetical protein